MLPHAAIRKTFLSSSFLFSSLHPWSHYSLLPYNLENHLESTLVYVIQFSTLKFIFSLTAQCAVLCCAVLSRSVVSDSLWPHGLQPTRLLCPWGFSRQEYRSGLPCPPPGDHPNPGIETRSPMLQADTLPSEPPGKPKKTGVDSLFLFQGIFPSCSVTDLILKMWPLMSSARI